METEMEITYPDYKKIKKESNCIDCTIMEEDFNTGYPNPYRVDNAAQDIYRYLRYKERTEINGVEC